MKILKICGIVAGLHALALILIFANPGCSSSLAQSKPDKPAPSPTDAPLSTEPPPAITVPNASSNAPAAPAADAPAGLNPVASDSVSAASTGAILFNPTRPGTTAAAALEAQPVANVTPASTYVVGRGDSLWTIAKKNHLKISTLVEANRLRPGATLFPGEKLIIPGATPTNAPAIGNDTEPFRAAAVAAAPPSGQTVKYVVKPGETLGAIARKYNVRVGTIATANNISDPQKIHPGQVLIIPGGHGGLAHGSPSPAPRSGPPNGAGASSSEQAPTPPPLGQDLDSGLKPSPDANSAPVLKVDDSAPPKS